MIRRALHDQIRNVEILNSFRANVYTWLVPDRRQAPESLGRDRQKPERVPFSLVAEAPNVIPL